MEDIDGKVKIPIMIKQAQPTFYFIIYKWRSGHCRDFVTAYHATKEHPITWLIEHRKRYPEEETYLLFYNEINEQLANEVKEELS